MNTLRSSGYPVLSMAVSTALIDLGVDDRRSYSNYEDCSVSLVHHPFDTVSASVFVERTRDQVLLAGAGRLRGGGKSADRGMNLGLGWPVHRRKLIINTSREDDLVGLRGPGASRSASRQAAMDVTSG